MNIPKIALTAIFAIPLVAIFMPNSPQAANPVLAQSTSQTTTSGNEKSSEQIEDASVAIFAGGCFWCVESDFDHVPGVITTISGYIGGNSNNPTYKTHSKDRHREAVEITYDPSVTSYEKLLNAFWRSVNPTDEGGQFCDRGHSYTTAIYTLDQNQFDLASASKTALVEDSLLDKPVVTEIVKAGEFYPAEGYHQDYYEKNPVRYKLYRKACGRDKAIQQVWGEQAHAGISEH